MAIDVETEDLVTLRQAAELIPSHPCLATLHRWRLTGVRGRKLETILVGGLRYTSREAVWRFLSSDETTKLDTTERPQ